MLAKPERLSRVQFSSFFKSGRRHHNDVVTVVHTPYSSFHGSIVVSKKVARKAVDRNKIRRQIYGQLYTAKKQGGTGVLIVLVKPGFAVVPRKQALSQIKNLIDRALKIT